MHQGKRIRFTTVFVPRHHVGTAPTRGMVVRFLALGQKSVKVCEGPRK